MLKVDVATRGMLLCLVFCLAGFGCAPLAAQTDLHVLLEKFWAAPDASGKSKCAKELLALQPDFDSLYTALAKGRGYADTVQTGFFEWNYVHDEFDGHCLVFVPHGYSPRRQYELRIVLHGGIANTNPQAANTWVDRSKPAYQNRQYITLYPSGWFLRPWVHPRRHASLLFLLDRLKRTYNIDENRVHLQGISDGGTGVYYLANCSAHQWATVQPFISNLGNLNHAGGGKVWPTFANNYANLPVLAINTENDEIFPLREVLPYFGLLREAGAALDVHIVPNMRHTMEWFPAYVDTIDSFVAARQREPHPKRVLWQTDKPGDFGRCHWVVVEKLGKSPDFSRLPDHNLLPGTTTQALPRHLPSGIVEAVRNGNTIEVATANVKRYVLLLSPDVFDFGQPVKVFTNGQLSFEGMLEASSETLLKYAAIDNDRKVLYGAELEIKVD